MLVAGLAEWATQRRAQTVYTLIAHVQYHSTRCGTYRSHAAAYLCHFLYSRQASWLLRRAHATWHFRRFSEDRSQERTLNRGAGNDLLR
jgi:hypothetical protein